MVDEKWTAQLEHFSLGWATARIDGVLAGFVNLAWDGGVHGFIVDTIVPPLTRHRGIGRAIVAFAEHHARGAGLEWLHVDFGADLAPFYRSCGSTPTGTGLIRL